MIFSPYTVAIKVNKKTIEEIPIYILSELICHEFKLRFFVKELDWIQV